MCLARHMDDPERDATDVDRRCGIEPTHDEGHQIRTHRHGVGERDDHFAIALVTTDLGAVAHGEQTIVDDQRDREDGLEIGFVEAGKRSSAVGGLHLRAGDHVLDSVVVAISAAIEPAQFVVENAGELDIDRHRAWDDLVDRADDETFGFFIDAERGRLAVDEHLPDVEFGGIENDLPSGFGCCGGDDHPTGERGLTEVRFEFDVVSLGQNVPWEPVRIEVVLTSGHVGERSGTVRLTFVPFSDPSSRFVPRADGSRFDVVGIGNALVDVISHADDSFIERQALTKGSMTLVDTDRALHLYRALGSAVEMSGGSAANTVSGVASFGGLGAYVGKVSSDELGEVFGHDLHAVGVHFAPGAHLDEIPTGRCIIVVTPDAQRTMNTYLGVSSYLCPDDVDEAVVAEGRVLYMEGYLFDRDDAKEAFRHAARIAHRAGRQVSLTLSDSFCVDRHRDDFRALVEDEVDVLFANEDELCSLYETENFEAAVASVRRDSALAVVTRGPLGAAIVTRDGIVPIAAEPVDHVLDTTGAGDLFAAGFLYGITNGRSLSEAGRLGAIAASEVISHVGPRPLVELRSLDPRS